MTKRLSAKGSRDKGLKFERELIAFVKQSLDLDVARGVAGAQAFDHSRGSSDIFGLPRLAVEAKRTERFLLNEFMAQAVRNATGGDMPLVIHRQSRQPTGEATVAIRLSDFFTIYDAFLRYHGLKPDDR